MQGMESTTWQPAATPQSASQAERLLAGQNRVLRMVASGVELQRILEEIIRFMESESEEALCSVLLLDEEGRQLQWASAPSLPEAYNRDISGLLVGPQAGSCGTAVFRRQPVIVTDIAQDPLWTAARALALSHGLRACTSSPILDSTGKVLGTFAFYYRTPRPPSPYDLRLIEVSRDLAGIAIERTRRVAELQEAVQARDTFLAVASNELKTPLTTLALQVQGLRRLQARSPGGAVLSQALGPRVDNLERQATRLQRLVEHLLDVSRLVANRLELEPEPLELSELVREVAERHEGPPGAGHVPLQLQLQPGVGGRWDRFRLDQVVSNLVSNALKFGEGRPVRVAVYQRGDRAFVEVEDQGIGIAPEDQARIFQKFERAVSVRNFGGFGLGLWISRQLVEAMGGRLQVHSTLGVGATFTVELPCHEHLPAHH